MLSLIKRYRELIVVSVLLLYPFGTFLARGRTARDPNFIDQGIIAISAPIQGALGWFIDTVVAGWTGYVDLRGVKDHNDQLLKENTQLRARVQALNEVELENGRLRELLAYADDRMGHEVVGRVIGVNPASNVHSVRINRGANHGVQKGAAVVTSDGVVGQVIQVTGQYADVMLLTDVNSRLAIRVHRSRARATASGLGGDQPLRVENLLRTEDLKDGDIIVTAGTDGVFPPGLVVGTANAVQKRNTGMFQSAELLPAVDMTRLEEVLVLPLFELSNGAALQAGGEDVP
ncbi:MAG: rod shape-determining protein MreC [Myxococcaceae bacterium]